jgi:hypothetical protein
LTLKGRTAIALILTIGWGCDYTPGPTPASSPSPSSTESQGQQPIVIVPIPNPGLDVPPGPSTSVFKIVLATPPVDATINLPASPVAPVHRPTLDFEFKYPQNLTLDDDFTNIEITLLRNNTQCLGTDLGHSIRLDREDKVYVANSVALFRTGTWRRGFGPSCVGRGNTFTTDQVRFTLTPNVSRTGQTSVSIPMEWNFVVR